MSSFVEIRVPVCGYSYHSTFINMDEIRSVLFTEDVIDNELTVQFFYKGVSDVDANKFTFNRCVLEQQEEYDRIKSILILYM